MEIITLITNVSGLRYETVHGREYAVAPITVLRPQVLDGSKGPLYYPRDEISKNYQQWNGLPLVVYHPQLNGANVSARIPEMMKSEIGRIYNTNITTDGDMKVEGWFDVELTKKVDSRIWNDLVNGNKIEVSTGLFTDNHDAPTNSQFNGKGYTHIARNYRPDHLAILPDQVGACSIREGCGVFNNAGEQIGIKVDTVALIKEAILKIEQLEGAMPGYGQVYYNSTTGEVWYVGGDGDTPEFVAQVDTILKEIEGIKSVRYESEVSPKDETYLLLNTKGNTMDRAKAIVWLTTNCDCYRGKADTLKNMSDADFNKALLSNADKAVDKAVDNEDTKFFEWMSNASDEVKKAFVASMKKKIMGQLNNVPPVPPVKKPDDDKANPAPTPNPDPSATPPTETDEDKRKKAAMMNQDGTANNQLSDEAYLKTLPSSIKATILNARRIETKDKLRLCGLLTANISNVERKKELFNKYMTKDLPELEELLEMMPKPTNNGQTSNNTSNAQPNNWFDQVNHSQSAQVTNSNVDENDVLEIPTTNWKDEAAKYQHNGSRK